MSLRTIVVRHWPSQSPLDANCEIPPSFLEHVPWDCCCAETHRPAALTQHGRLEPELAHSTHIDLASSESDGCAQLHKTTIPRVIAKKVTSRPAANAAGSKLPHECVAYDVVPHAGRCCSICAAPLCAMHEHSKLAQRLAAMDSSPQVLVHMRGRKHAPEVQRGVARKIGRNRRTSANISDISVQNVCDECAPNVAQLHAPSVCVCVEEH